MQAQSGPPQTRSNPRDLRRAISRQTWLANRARNALRRPVFIGAVSVATFVMAIVSMVVAPRTERPVATAPEAVRPDTLMLAANSAMARVRLAEADSAIAADRAVMAAATPRTDTTFALTESTTVIDPVRRDSILARVRKVDSLRLRVEQAPLPASYRALAGLPELRDDTRVLALVDSLSRLERERGDFGAAGGVDPVFVALTTRVNEMGRAIHVIATERRTAMLAGLQPPRPQVAPVAVTPAVDSTVRVAQRDSLRATLATDSSELSRRRIASLAMDMEEDRARERASAVAPPLALLASAFVLSAVIGFAVALIGELRKPRVSNANELERFLGMRVLSTVETPTPSVERGRRQADRAAPPNFDPGAEGFQLAYLGLSNDHPSLLAATITGDDPRIAAVVACNLAAIAADEARNTLVVDLESSCSASATLQSRATPGIVDILRGQAQWPDVTVAAPVGRDKTVDLVPYGVGSAATSAPDLIRLIEQDSPRVTRYYDAVLFLASAADAGAGIPAAAPSPAVVFCAQPGITPLRQLRKQLDQIRDAGGAIRGIVLWSAERPLLPTPRELAAGASRTPSPRVAVATT